VPELERDALLAHDDAIETDFAIEAARNAIVLPHFERNAAAIELARLGLDSFEQHRTDTEAAH
jgi:hypothetical protein